MSLERAGEFVLEFIADEEATGAADLAYLQAVADLAESRGYDVTVDELTDAFRSLAVLDGDEDVAGFRSHLATVTVTVRPGGHAANTATSPSAATAFTPVGYSADYGSPFGGAGFQLLGFLR